MKNRILLLSIAVLTCLPGLHAQTTATGNVKAEPVLVKQPTFGITLSGYVKTDIIFDTRQTIGLRDGQFLLYPDAKKPDAEGKDINATGSFDILNIQSRLAGTLTGPDALGAKTSGYIEAEFFGNINTAINSFRLRHAWVKLNWKNTEFMAGQWWHPMFVPDCAPATVSFNTGAPFVVFSRNPQLKLTQTFGKVKMALSLLSQIDFMSDGPDGASTKYLRNSSIPESNLQLWYTTKNESTNTEFMIGAGINYQVILPRMSTSVIYRSAHDTIVNNVIVHQDALTRTYKTNTLSTALAANFYTKLKLKKVTFKLGGEYGENNNSYTMLGGYVVKSITDTARGFVNYANDRSFATWAEVHSNAQRWQPGLFIGFAKNLETGTTVTGPFYSRGSNIDYIYRVSPRLVFNVNKVRLAGEVEYTAAAYGTTNAKGYVSNSKEVANLRVLLGVYYFF